MEPIGLALTRMPSSFWMGVIIIIAALLVFAVARVIEKIAGDDDSSTES